MPPRRRGKRKRRHTLAETCEAKEIHSTGYHLFRQAVVVDTATRAHLERRSRSMKGVIFNNQAAGNDRKRRQKRLCFGAAHTKNGVLDKFAGDLSAFIRERISETLRPADWVLLKSAAGCHRQVAHTDYEPSEELAAAPHDQVPLLVIVALQDKTTLDVWPGSIKLISKLECLGSSALAAQPEIQRTQLHMNEGDILVFRADLVHAGSAYDAENVRIHCFLDSDTVPRPPGATFRMDRASREHPEIARIIRDIV